MWILAIVFAVTAGAIALAAQRRRQNAEASPAQRLSARIEPRL
jgi:hypothetical protein